MTRRVGEHREGQVERLLLVLMGARLALALGSLGLGVALDALGGEVPATRFPGFYVAVAACFVATLVYRPFVGRIRRPGPFAAINVITDLGLVSALVFFSGGVHSIFTFLFLVVAPSSLPRPGSRRDTCCRRTRPGPRACRRGAAGRRCSSSRRPRWRTAGRD